MTFTAELK